MQFNPNSKTKSVILQIKMDYFVNRYKISDLREHCLTEKKKVILREHFKAISFGLAFHVVAQFVVNLVRNFGSKLLRQSDPFPFWRKNHCSQAEESVYQTPEIVAIFRNQLFRLILLIICSIFKFLVVLNRGWCKMMVEDLGIEAKEAAVREVAKLLPLPELLQSISSIKADYITRQQVLVFVELNFYHILQLLWSSATCAGIFSCWIFVSSICAGALQVLILMVGCRTSNWTFVVGVTDEEKSLI